MVNECRSHRSRFAAAPVQRRALDGAYALSVLLMSRGRGALFRSRRPRLGGDRRVPAGAGRFVGTVADPDRRPVVSRSPGARDAGDVRGRVPVGRTDRDRAGAARQHAPDRRRRPLARSEPGVEGDAGTQRCADGRRSARGADRRGDHQGHRHRAAVLADARRVRQHPRRLRLRRARRLRIQLVRIRDLRAAELRAVRARRRTASSSARATRGSDSPATRCSPASSARRSAIRAVPATGGSAQWWRAPACWWRCSHMRGTTRCPCCWRSPRRRLARRRPRRSMRRRCSVCWRRSRSSAPPTQSSSFRSRCWCSGSSWRAASASAP